MNMLKDLYNRFINDYPFIQVISCAALAVIIFILLLVILIIAYKIARLAKMQRLATCDNEVLDSLELIDEEDSDPEEDEEPTSKEENEEIESSIINLQDESQQKLTTPRKMSLRLRLNNSTDALKGRYSKLRNYLESFKIRHSFLKHREIFYVIDEVVNHDENGNVVNKNVINKLAMITIRRKQLILSLNMDLDLIKNKQNILHDNLVIEERRYEGYTLNLRISTEYRLREAMEIISLYFLHLDISSKKHHKDIDYVKEFSEELSTFESRGFGYLVRDSITFEEADKYNDSLCKKAIVLNKISERAPSKINEYTISLDKISESFSNGAKVNLDVLKQNKLASKDVNKLIVTDGTSLNKKLFIEADGYSSNAIKMIFLTGGEAKINHRISR